MIRIDKKITSWSIKKETNQRTTDIQYNNAPLRPDEIPCDIHHVNVKGEAWVILVGMLNGKPYEVLGGLSKNIEIPSKYKQGTVKKLQRKTVNSRYDLRFGEPDAEITIKDVISVFDNPNYGALTRMISMSLRHGVPVQYIVEQLQKDKESDMFSFSKVLSRVIKNYIGDGIKASITCSECGSSNLIYQGGCPTCKDCGNSKCG